jgi:hypothetical protein
MQRLCGGIFAFPGPGFMVKLICHKVVLEVILKPFSKGFGSGKSADQLQQFYGFIFLFDNSPVTLIPKKGFNMVQVPQKPAPVEL